MAFTRIRRVAKFRGHLREEHNDERRWTHLSWNDIWYTVCKHLRSGQPIYVLLVLQVWGRLLSPIRNLASVVVLGNVNMTLHVIISLTNMVFSLIGLVLVFAQSKRPYSRAINIGIIAVGVVIIIMSTILLVGNPHSIAYWIDVLGWIIIIILNLLR